MTTPWPISKPEVTRRQVWMDRETAQIAIMIPTAYYNTYVVYKGENETPEVRTWLELNKYFRKIGEL
jgi:hypothetical protein